MRQRPLGHTGWTVSDIGLPAPDDAQHRAVRDVYDSHVAPAVHHRW